MCRGCSSLASHTDALTVSSRVPPPRTHGGGTRDETLRSFAWEVSSSWVYINGFILQMFSDYKDEIYEEDLQEGWHFLGRKKVGIFLQQIEY